MTYHVQCNAFYAPSVATPNAGSLRMENARFIGPFLAFWDLSVPPLRDGATSVPQPPVE
jgi:hypothetical protein